MKETYILAIDQGTTSTRSIIFNRKGQIMASSKWKSPKSVPITDGSNKTRKKSSKRLFKQSKMPKPSPSVH